MPGNRPYDAELLNNVTAQMHAGTIHTTPSPPAPTVIHQPGFEHHHGGKIDSSISVLRGMADVFTPAGRLRRAERQAESLQRYLDVSRYIVDRVMNPRGGDPTPTKKIGWVGTS